ncbi:MAG: hypothetical protein Q9182_004203 [Xanthomendoza sp. 2 TL-2023]
MAGRFKPFAKALLGCLGFTAVQQVGIDVDPVILSQVENFVIEVLDTLPTDDMIPNVLSAGFNTIFAMQLVMMLLLMVLSMLLGFYLGKSRPDLASIIPWTDLRNALTDVVVWSPQGATEQASPPINHPRNRMLDRAFNRLHFQRRFLYKQKQRQRVIDQRYRSTVAADEVELVTGTTMPATVCSLTVPVYGNIYIDFDALFAGSDAERMLFALLFCAVLTKSAAAVGDVQQQLNDQRVELATVQDSLKSSEDGLVEERARNAALEIRLAEEKQLSSTQKEEITTLESMVAGTTLQISGLTDTVTKLHSELAEEQQLSSTQKKVIATLQSTAAGTALRISGLTDTITKLRSELAEQKQLSSNLKQEITTLQSTMGATAFQTSVLIAAVTELFETKDNQIQDFRAQIAKWNRRNLGAADVTYAIRDTMKDCRITFVKDLEVANRKQASRIIELGSRAKKQSSSFTFSAGPDAADSSTTSTTTGHMSSANNQSPTIAVDIDAPSGNAEKAVVKLLTTISEHGESSTSTTEGHVGSANESSPLNAGDSNAPSANTGKAVVRPLITISVPGESSISTTQGHTSGANNRSPTNADNVDAPSGNTGKAVRKFPITASERAREMRRMGEASGSSTQGETQSQSDKSVRIASPPKVIHQRDQKPCTDRKNVQEQDPDHPHHDGTGDGSQAAEQKPHKRHRRGRRKPKNKSRLGAAVTDTEAGSEGGSLLDDDQNIDDA